MSKLSGVSPSGASSKNSPAKALEPLQSLKLVTGKHLRDPEHAAQLIEGAMDKVACAILRKFKSPTKLAQFAKHLEDSGHAKAAQQIWTTILRNPPFAEREPVSYKEHEYERVDPYGWLDNINSKMAKYYLDRENAYGAAVLARHSELSNALYNDFLSRIPLHEDTAPVRLGAHEVIEQWHRDANYPEIALRRRKGAEEPSVVLDLNALAQRHSHFDLAQYQFDRRQSMLAFSIDTTGGERYNIWVKDLRSGKIAKDELVGVHGAFALGPNGRELYYTTIESGTERPCCVYRHQIGNDQSCDELLYENDNPGQFVSVSRGTSLRYIYVHVCDYTRSEVHFLDTRDPSRRLHSIEPFGDIEYDVAEYLKREGDCFYIRTNADGAKNFKIMRAPVTAPSRENWREVVPEDPEFSISDMIVVPGYLFLNGRQDGLARARGVRLRTGRTFDIGLPEGAQENDVCSITVDDPEEYNSAQIDIRTSSPTSPESVFTFDPRRRTFSEPNQDQYLRWNRSGFINEREYAPAADGTLVPITVTYRKDIDFPAPLFLIGYGSYGMSLEHRFGDWPRGFQYMRMALLERDFVYALAHVRGGGEYGEEWYSGGRGRNKINSFTDFIACLEHLHERGYSTPEKTAVFGRSAGGALVGGVCNMRPDLMKVAILGVPFVDGLHALMNPHRPLAVPSWGEWGNPRKNRENYRAIRRWSAIDGVKEQEYPSMYISAGLTDPRVLASEPLKYAARLRAMKRDDAPLVVRVDKTAGHFGASGRKQQLKELSELLAFTLHELDEA